MRKQIQIFGFLILTGTLSLNIANLKAQTTGTAQQTLAKFSDINLNKILLPTIHTSHSAGMALNGFPTKMSTATLADGRTEIIFQEWNESVWQNAQRMVLAAGYEYSAVARFLNAWDSAHPTSMGFDLDLFPCPFSTDFSWLVQTWQNNAWINDTHLYVDGDGQGKLAAVHMDTWTNNAWAPNACFTFTYHDDQFLAETTFQVRIDNQDQMKDFIRVTYDYNNANQLSEQLMLFTADPGWTALFKRLITYDANGYPDRDLMQLNMGTADESNFMNFTLFDEDYSASGQILGRVFQEADFTLMEGTLFNIWKKIWTWEGTNIIEEQIKQWHESTWVDSLREQAVYDNDQCTYWLMQSYQDGWVNQSQGILTDNTPEGPLEEIQQRWENDTWVNTEKTRYSYEDEKLVQILNQTWNSSWINVSRQSYNRDMQTDVEEHNGQGPSGFVLGNYPNPFNPSTTVTYTLAAAAKVSLTVYDIKGRQVRTLIDDTQKNRGAHEACWDGRDHAGQTVPSGVYLYQLKAGKQVKTGRCLLLK